MNLTVCMGHTGGHYEKMARVAARSIRHNSPEAKVRITQVEDVGYQQNMGTRFLAYGDESADWVLACDCDVLCFDDLMPLARRAEEEGLDFVGRISGRYHAAPGKFNLAAYAMLFRKHKLPELTMHVPNVSLIRGQLSKPLAEHAAYWTNYLYETGMHVLDQPLWSDQVGFTLALAQMLSPRRMGFFRREEVSNAVPARKLAKRPCLVHYGTRRWQRLWASGQILGMLR